VRAAKLGGQAVFDASTQLFEDPDQRKLLEVPRALEWIDDLASD
jgi:hypothetical protein